jgi:mRNA-degrading endonuclease RelE of RelBE toxin-antitoxin system
MFLMWHVQWKRKLEKQLSELPEQVQLAFKLLVSEIQSLGPIRGNWKNYSKLSTTKHHCHIKFGRPTYVCCWEVIDKQGKMIEVYYAGTHEKAPY